MSFADRLRHDLLVKHPDPGTSPDATGQLFVDETGQPIGDPTVSGTDDWTGAAEVRGFVDERRARWPEGPGAGPELVETTIYLPHDTSVTELDRIKRTDIEQVYQVVFVHDHGRSHHKECVARRIPL